MYGKRNVWHLNMCIYFSSISREAPLTKWCNETAKNFSQPLTCMRKSNKKKEKNTAVKTTKNIQNIAQFNIWL